MSTVNLVFENITLDDLDKVNETIELLQHPERLTPEEIEFIRNDIKKNRQLKNQVRNERKRFRKALRKKGKGE